MGEQTGIEWTDSTISFWWGCRKVGPGCDHCYAEAWAKRFGIPDYENSGVRRKIKGAIATIRRLQRTAAKFEAKHGRRRRVFIQSMSDFFDNEVDPAWRAEAWAEMVAADRLDIQLVTKRVTNVRKMIDGPWPAHVGLIITVVNQDEADRDVLRLLDLKVKARIPWVGLSIEPLLSAIDLTRLPVPAGGWYDALNGKISAAEGSVPFPAVDWVIVGGESGRNARPIHPDWVRQIRDACAAAGVPFLWKQWGEWAPWRAGTPDPKQVLAISPEGLIRRDDGTAGFTGEAWMSRVGKKDAGRLLDGRTHDEFPRIAA